MPEDDAGAEVPAPATTVQSSADPPASPGPRPWPTARPDIDLVIWTIWPLISWVMPVLVYLLMFRSGGWEMLLLLPFMVVIIPGLALLGLLPRVILRRAGAPSSPSVVSVAMLVNWWSHILFGLSHRGLGDSGGIDSFLGGVFDIGDQLQQTLSVTAVLIALMSYATAILAATMTADRHRGLGMSPWITGAAMVAIPLLLLGLVKVIAVTGAAQDDAAAAAQAQEWDDAQRSLVPLRLDIAEEGWVITCCGMDDHDPRSYEDGQPRLASMSVFMNVAIDGAPSDAFDTMTRTVEAHGWEITGTEVHAPGPDAPTDVAPPPSPSPPAEVPLPLQGEAFTGVLTATNDSSELLTIRVESTGGVDDSSTIVTVGLYTAPRPASEVIEVLWWEEARDDVDDLPPIDDVRFRYDEWPSLLRIES